MALEKLHKRTKPYTICTRKHNITRKTYFWTDLIQTNFKWNKVVILEPEETTTPYHIGFKNDYEKKCELCSIILKGPVALLLGPHQTEFFAVSQEGTPLQLKKISYSDKHRLEKTIPLI